MYLINSYKFGGAAPVSPDFTMLVKTDNAGTSASDQFTIPTTGTGYNYDVDWGDGTTSTGVTGSTTHTFPSAGNYVVKISGAFPRIYFNNGGDRLKLLEVQNWGNIVWKTFYLAFFNCANMNITANDTPDLSAITITGEFYYAFRQCNIQNSPKISDWDVSIITDFRTMFYANSNFNENLNGWNMSSASLLSDMFTSCTSFNQPLDNWDVSNVVNLSGIFYNSAVFNQDLSGWDVSLCGTFQNMFRLSSFNHNIGNWQIASLTNASAMFFNSGMSTANYTDTIVGWANYVFTNGAPLNVNMGTQNGRTFDTSRSGGANFANAGAARTYLTTATPTGAGWTISGDTVI
jgi:surface protein